MLIHYTMDTYLKDRIISVSQNSLMQRGIANLGLTPWLWTLFKHLPMLISAQYDYENRTVSAGLQLLFSDYLKSLVVLAFAAKMHYILPYKQTQPNSTKANEAGRGGGTSG